MAVHQLQEFNAAIGLVVLFKNPVRTTKRTPHFTVTETNKLMLFKEIIAGYSKKHMNPINRNKVTDYCSRW
jgi:hypothetical protein